jgi:hypothetical protein
VRLRRGSSLRATVVVEHGLMVQASPYTLLNKQCVPCWALPATFTQKLVLWETLCVCGLRVCAQMEAGGLSFEPKVVDICNAVLGTVRRGRGYVRHGISLRYSLPAGEVHAACVYCIMFVCAQEVAGHAGEGQALEHTLLLAFLPGTLVFNFHIHGLLPAGGTLALLDVRRLTQIISNGLSNAGKFADRESVDVFMTVVESRSGRYIVLDISNMGVGLPANSESLFVPFKGLGAPDAWSASDAHLQSFLRDIWLSTAGERLAASYCNVAVSRASNGPTTATTGLGLPLSRAFATSCGGCVGLEDTEGPTTHFWCVLPAEAPPAAQRSASGELVVPMMPKYSSSHSRGRQMDCAHLQVVVVDGEIAVHVQHAAVLGLPCCRHCWGRLPCACAGEGWGC